MAILFDWYENPVSPDQPKKKRFHPRIAYNGQVDTDEIRSKIQSRCTLNEVDVRAVLDALSQVMGEELGEGRQIHLDGIGYFYPTLTATEEIAADTPRRNMKIKLKAIRFRSHSTTACQRAKAAESTPRKRHLPAFSPFSRKITGASADLWMSRKIRGQAHRSADCADQYSATYLPGKFSGYES